MNDTSGKRGSALGSNTPSSSSFSNSSNSRIIDNHKFQKTMFNKTYPNTSSSSDAVNKTELNKQFELVNDLLNENENTVNIVPLGRANPVKNLVIKTPSCECESKLTGLDIQFNDTIKQLSMKFDRTFDGLHNLILQHVAVNKMMSKKLEEFGHEAKADLGALEKKCQAFEIENKELKKEVKTLAERMDRDNEKNKQNLDKLTKDILMVVKMASKLTNNQKKLETENQVINSQLQHLREVIGIDNAMKGLSISNDSSYNNKKEEANKTN